MEKRVFTQTIGEERVRLFIALGMFFHEMEAKLEIKQNLGWREWSTASPNKLRERLLDNAARDEWVDVANFAMFLWSQQNKRPLLNLAALSEEQGAELSRIRVGMGADRGKDPVEILKRLKAKITERDEQIDALQKTISDLKTKTLLLTKAP